MAGEPSSRWGRIRASAQKFFEEKGIETDEKYFNSRLHRFAHFWLLVAKSFNRNRCPVRAASLAYTTLLALVPLLAVGVSITTSMLQKQGEEPVHNLINKLVNYVAPALDLETRDVITAKALEMGDEEAALFGITNNADLAFTTTTPIDSTTNRLAVTGRDRVVKQITSFIGNIRAGTLGITSVLA